MDQRSPIRQVVDAILAVIEAGPSEKQRPILRDQFRELLPAEEHLWLCVLVDAVDCARRIREGRSLPATNEWGEWEAAEMDNASQRRELRLWVAGDYHGSLQWIAGQLGISDATTSRIAARVTEDLDESRRRRAA